MIYRCFIVELSFLIDDDMFRQRCQLLFKIKKNFGNELKYLIYNQLPAILTAYKVGNTASKLLKLKIIKFYLKNGETIIYNYNESNA